MEHNEGLHLSRRAAWSRNAVRLVKVLCLEVHQALEEGVVICWIESWRTAADADVGVEGGGLLDELKSGNLSQVDLHFLAAAARPFARKAVDFAVGFDGGVKRLAAMLLRCDKERREI